MQLVVIFHFSLKDQLLPRRVTHNQPLFPSSYYKGSKAHFLLPLLVDQRRCRPLLNITMCNATTQVSWRERFWLFICLVSFLCALGIFTESQFYAYTIRIHGTHAQIIYYVVGVTLFSAIHVLLIKQPDCCKAFHEVYGRYFFLKSCGGYLVMFTICFLSSGTGLPYLGLSSDGTALSPAVAVALAPYRSQAFSEIAGLLAAALLTVNALSITILLGPAQHNTFFEVAAALTMESAIALLYKNPKLTVVAAVFILAMTLLKDFLCYDQVVKADDPAACKPPAGEKTVELPARAKAPRIQPAEAACKLPADKRTIAADDPAACKPPAGEKTVELPARAKAARIQPTKATSKLPVGK